jgi:hypothetical protein
MSRGLCRYLGPAHIVTLSRFALTLDLICVAHHAGSAWNESFGLYFWKAPADVYSCFYGIHGLYNMHPPL